MAEAVQYMRALHILFAAAWFGASLLWFLIIIPSMKRNDEALKQIMLRSGYGPTFGLMALGTVLFGVLTIFMQPSGTYSGTQMMILGPGMLAGVIGWIVGFGGHLPLNIKQKKAEAAGDDAAFQRYLAIDHKLDTVSFVVVVVAGISMVAFRFV